ncbi:hypothetical protein FRC08_006316 [Ceratobasidium sp. 394]|nr:hypothetical protein FRC08_006316 [Ceratobasidium sp. 394]
MAKHIWGLGFNEYSVRRFYPRKLHVPNKEMEMFHNTYGIPPPAILESTLCRGDPRATDFGFMRVHTIMETMGEYMMKTNCRKPFDRYYGFLCFRHLLHTTCLCGLGEFYDRIRLLRLLQQGADWGDLFKLVANEALNNAEKATKDAASFEEFCKIFVDSRFIGRLGPGEFAAAILISLWQDRGSFLILCLRGLLPGCSLLLLITLKLLPLHPDKETVHEATFFLQHLVLRLYLVGSHRDRQILQYIFLATQQMLVSVFEPDTLFVGPEDSRMVSQAYSGLLSVWQQDGSSTRNVPVKLMDALSGDVVGLSTFNPSATTGELIDVAGTSLKFLWLLLEHRGRVPTLEHAWVKRYCSGLFQFIWVIEKRISGQEARHRLAQMLADTEIISLAGRVVLFALDPENGFRNVNHTNEPDTTLEDLSKIGGAIKKSVITAPELFADSKLEWAKVLAYLESSREIGTGQQTERARYIRDTLEAWAGHSSALKDKYYEPQKCAHPRCARLLTCEKALRLHYRCGRCNQAAYCDSTCQTTHWQLATSQSHKLECKPSSG